VAATPRTRALARAASIGVLLPVLLAGTACTTGLLYTHVTVPLDLDAEGAAMHDAHGRQSVDMLALSVLRVAWGSAGIGSTAREHGFETIAYADLESLTVLGIWRQQYAVIYGTRPVQP
jgi:hypothetical protein